MRDNRLGPAEQAALTVLRMVHELHKRGYQRLRIMPGMSPSGMHWRVAILPVNRILRSHGAMSRDWVWSGGDPFYTSGDDSRYFQWADASNDGPAALAEKFLKRFPDAAEAGRGADWAYAGWYLEILAKAERGELPVAYADWYDEPDPRWLPTTAGFESGLPMPPPGEAEDLLPSEKPEASE